MNQEYLLQSTFPDIKQLLNDYFGQYFKEILSVDSLKNDKIRDKLYIKTNDEYILCCSDLSDELSNNVDSPLFWLRNVLMDKKGTLIATQFNKILKNKEALKFIKTNKDRISKFSVEKSYEGSLLTLFYKNLKWNVSTRKCIDADKSNWTSISHYKLLEDVIGTINDENLENLGFSQNMFYNIVIIHNKLFGVVDYSADFGKDYKKIMVIGCHELNTLEKKVYVNKSNNKNIIESFKLDITLDDIMDDKIRNKLLDEITTEGLIVKLFDKNERCVTLKLQTSKYQKLNKMKPNSSNEIECYIDMLRQKKLEYFLFESRGYDKEKINNIRARTVAQINSAVSVLHKLYDETRIKRNNSKYISLEPVYKKALYMIHGIFLERRNKSTSKNLCRITVYDVLSIVEKYPTNKKNGNELYLTAKDILIISTKK